MVIGTPTVLNLIPGKVFPVVNVNQYDAGYQKTFLLYKGAEQFNIASNMSVTIRGTKGDKKGITDSAAHIVGSNLITVTLTEQMTAVAGPNICELRIVDTNGLLAGTVNFVLMVEPAALGDGTVISDSDLDYAADVLDKLQSVEAFKNQLDAATADIEDLQEEDTAIKYSVAQKRGMVTVDMWMDNKIPSAYTLQGGCYTENGRFVFAVQTGVTDMVKLFCVDSNTFSTVWESSPLKLYHANSVAYRPQDRKLYIAACFSDTDTNTLLKTILVVDYDTHSSVERTITSPAPGGIYSVAHDAETDIFYSTNYRGTTAGQADMLYEYNGVFESVNRTIQLDDLSAHDPIVHSSQGVQVVANGIAFFPYYNPGRTVVGYNLKDGARAVIGNIPDIANEYRNIGEIEFLAYDGNDFYIGFKAINTGIPENTFWNIAKIGLFHNIVIHDKFPHGGSISAGDFEVSGAPLDLNKASHKPSSMDARFYSLSDIIRFQRFNSSYINVLVQNSADQNSLLIGHISANGFKGSIAPRYSGKTVQIERLDLRNSTVRFESCRFVGTENAPTGEKVNLVVRSGDDYLIGPSCSFENVSGNAYGISAHENSSIIIPYGLLSSLSYKKVYARNTKLLFSDNAMKFVNASEFNFDSTVDFTGLYYVLKSFGDITTGTTFSVDGILLNRPIKVSSAQNSVTENIINTSQGIGSIKFNDSGGSGSIRRVIYELNVNNNTMTLKTVNYFENTGYSDGSHFNNMIYQ